MATPAPKGPAKPAPNPLLNPNATLQGPALQNAATSLTNSQTIGPITELAREIAQQQAQGAAAEKLTSGYFNQLMPYVQAGNALEGGIANNLNTTLTGIGNDTQAQLRGIGQNTTQSLLAHAPQGQGAGLSTPAISNLTAEIARQQGLAAQDSGTARLFGASQGANYQGLAASNLGTFGLKGQEALKGISQATRLSLQPLNSKMAGLQAARGALLATNEGKLRQQEITNQVTRAGLGIKAAQVNTTAQNDRANQQIKIRGQNIAAQDAAAARAQSNLNNLRTTGTSAANTAANNSTRVLLAQLRAQAKAGKGATPTQSQAIYSHIDYVTGEIQNLIKIGYSPQTAYHIIENGGRVQVGKDKSGKPVYHNYSPNRWGTEVLNAGYNVRGGGSGLSPGDVAWLKSMGVNPGRYRRGSVGSGVGSGSRSNTPGG